ncbi:MAG: hypothetical protein HYS81_05195 [Candidatus Aenigmatarchaeota archaeon]|nr:MAG: hypothetical protein HYS81_05195 [Candidatus Aenigmarchaeota archaeon]
MGILHKTMDERAASILQKMHKKNDELRVLLYELSKDVESHNLDMYAKHSDELNKLYRVVITEIRDLLRENALADEAERMRFERLDPLSKILHAFANGMKHFSVGLRKTRRDMLANYKERLLLHPLREEVPGLGAFVNNYDRELGKLDQMIADWETAQTVNELDRMSRLESGFSAIVLHVQFEIVDMKRVVEKSSRDAKTAEKMDLYNDLSELLDKILDEQMMGYVGVYDEVSISRLNQLTDNVEKELDGIVNTLEMTKRLPGEN